MPVIRAIARPEYEYVAQLDVAASPDAPSDGARVGSNSPGDGFFSEFIDAIWNFFISIRLAWALIAFLALLNIVGTFGLQNKALEEYRRAYPDWLINIFAAVGFFDVYASTLFLFGTLLLALNLIACSIDRFPMIWAAASHAPDPTLSPKRRLPFMGEVSLTSASSRAPDIEALVKKTLRTRVFKAQKDGATHLFIHRNRYRRMGVYVIHTGLLTVMFGGMYGAIFGEHGFVFLREGDQQAFYQTQYVGRLVGEEPLPFTIRCNDFEMLRYVTGEPKDYYSDLSILEDGKEVARKRIEVNGPMEWRGYQIYQSSFQDMPPEAVFHIDFINRSTGNGERFEWRGGDSYTPPGVDATYRLVDFHPDLGGHGAAMQIEKAYKDGSADIFWVFERYPDFDRLSRPDAVSVVLVKPELRQRFMTGLQVGRNPGAMIVFIGGFILVFGLIYVFLFPHTRLWVRIEETRVVTAGWVDRGHVWFQDKFTELNRGIAALGGELVYAGPRDEGTAPAASSDTAPANTPTTAPNGAGSQA